MIKNLDQGDSLCILILQEFQYQVPIFRLGFLSKLYLHPSLLLSDLLCLACEWLLSVQQFVQENAESPYIDGMTVPGMPSLVSIVHFRGHVGRRATVGHSLLLIFIAFLVSL